MRGDSGGKAGTVAISNSGAPRESLPTPCTDGGARHAVGYTEHPFSLDALPDTAPHTPPAKADADQGGQSTSCLPAG